MTLPALPMGSIMTACMLVGAPVVACIGATGARAGAARVAARAVAAVLLVAGTWQMFWHFPRHATQTWGQAALVSGVLLAAGAAWCGSRRARGALPGARWPLAIGLGAVGVVYAVTIARL